MSGLEIIGACCLALLAFIVIVIIIYTILCMIALATIGKLFVDIADEINKSAPGGKGYFSFK